MVGCLLTKGGRLELGEGGGCWVVVEEGGVGGSGGDGGCGGVGEVEVEFDSKDV